MFSCLNSELYIAIIGDIKESKKIDNRDEVQKKLKSILEDMNTRYQEDISSNFIITLGDEFQGLLCNGARLMQIISEIEERMYPINIRFGVGIGKITTEINRELSIGADGPGYYNARAAIESLKEDEKRKRINAANVRFEAEEEKHSTVMMLNTITTLLMAIKDTWSDRQREVICEMLVHGESQVDVAKRLGVNQSTVQKILAKGKFYAYKDALDTIDKVMGEINV